MVQAVPYNFIDNLSYEEIVKAVQRKLDIEFSNDLVVLVEDVCNLIYATQLVLPELHLHLSLIKNIKIHNKKNQSKFLAEITML